MALLKPNDKSAKKYIRIYLPNSVIDETRNYCQWAKIQKLDDFFELAAEFVFKKDREWKDFKNNTKTNVQK